MGLTHKERETWWLQIHAFNIFLLYIPFTRAMQMIHVPTFNILYIESKCQFTINRYSFYWNNPRGAWEFQSETVKLNLYKLGKSEVLWSPL